MESFRKECKIVLVFCVLSAVSLIVLTDYYSVSFGYLYVCGPTKVNDGGICSFFVKIYLQSAASVLSWRTNISRRLYLSDVVNSSKETFSFPYSSSLISVSSVAAWLASQAGWESDLCFLRNIWAFTLSTASLKISSSSVLRSSSLACRLVLALIRWRRFS